MTLALAQLLLPGLVALWLSIGRPPRLVDLISRIVAGWVILAGVGLSGVWLALPISAVPFLAVLLFLTMTISVIQYRRGPASDASRLPLWCGRLVTGGLLMGGGWLLVPALEGRVEPPASVDLAFPLREGRYLVVNGGTTERVNAHLMTLNPRFAAWRGESFAVDLIQIDGSGFRTWQRRLLSMPKEPARYRTFGAEVIAPCSGFVEAAEEDHPDMPVPMRDRAHLAGNFVRLRCGRAVILLAHFKKGAVEVVAGDQVAIGQRLGLAGNSGNSDEPHLHIHAQRPGPPGAPLSGEPLFIRLEGRFLVRNMIVEAEPRDFRALDRVR